MTSVIERIGQEDKRQHLFKNSNKKYRGQTLRKKYLQFFEFRISTRDLFSKLVRSL
jgi:hypothetical protein